MRKAILTAALMVALATPVHSAVLSESEERTIELNLEAMAGYFSASEDYLAEGGKDWQEAYGKGTVAIEQSLANASTIYGGLGVIALGTFTTVSAWSRSQFKSGDGTFSPYFLSR